MEYGSDPQSPDGAKVVYAYDDVDRPTDIEHRDGNDELRLHVEYDWNLDNTVQERQETEYDANGLLQHTAIVTFYYDARKRLIQEVRVVDQSVVYDLEYEYDQLGNRTHKYENRDELDERMTCYVYDTNWDPDEEEWVDLCFAPDDVLLNPDEPYHDIATYPTRNNRLVEYRVYGPAEVSGMRPLYRTVVYQYFDTGHASHILIKDEYQGTGETPPEYDQWHGLEFVYTTGERLWLAIWGTWACDEEDWAPDDFQEITDAWEFRYDASGRQRYFARQWEADYPAEPDDWTPVTDPLCMDYLGELPFVDFTVDFSGGPPVDVEETRYLPGFGVQAEQLMTEPGDPAQYYHGDLIDSTMLTTDDNGGVVQMAAYTAFGEYVSSSGAVGGELPTGFPRYAYAGGYGYETGLITLYGPNPDLPPITLQHVGERWYQPGIGRFVQRDPIGLAGGLNVYVYCVNLPLTHIDPSGLTTAGEVIGGTLGAGAGAAAGGVIIVVIGIPTAGAGGVLFAAPIMAMCTALGGYAGAGIGKAIERDGLSGIGGPHRGGFFCFVEGTLVETSTGPVPIEELGGGDVVRSLDEEAFTTNTDASHALAVRSRVGGIASRLVHEVVRIRLTDETIVTTREHPFWVAGHGWVVAGQLRSGDCLLDMHGNGVPIAGVEVRTLSRPIRVYNLTVEDSHTFFVGKTKVLVHNKSV